jgi:peptidyl-prolyl cis-trans isomerase SDCCAG10
MKEKPTKKYDGAALLAAEREKFSKRNPLRVKGKRKEEVQLSDLVEGFRGRLRQALEEAPEERSKSPDQLPEGEAEQNSSGDEGWLSHSLRFRRDVTHERFTMDDYGVYYRPRVYLK